jgi:hypothetical protein
MTADGSEVLIVDGNEQIALPSTVLEHEVITTVVVRGE